MADAVKGLGGTRVFLVTDEGLVASGMIAEVTARLIAADLEVEVFSGLRPNPAIEEISAGGRALRSYRLG